MRSCAIRIAVACAKVKNKMVENWFQMVELIASIYFVIAESLASYLCRERALIPQVSKRVK
jgi:hypothetical protein